MLCYHSATLKKPTRHLRGAIILLLGVWVLVSAVAVRVVGADAILKPGASRARIEPGVDDGRIADFVARLLQSSHYTHQLFDQDISSQFLDRYIELLDPQHLHFLESDLARFERYRTNLENLTITPNHSADTTPAYEIAECFYERLKQRVAWVDDYLKNGKFDFSTDERIAIDRRKSPYPQNLDEAKALWSLRLRYEYLQEKLGLEAKKSKAAATNSAGEKPDTAAVTAEKTDPTKSVHQQIVETLGHRYHRNLRVFTDWNNEDVMGYYLTALARVYDPHSDYFNRAQVQSFRISMNLELFGIGAELKSDDEGYCKIERLLPFGPAAKSKKMTAGDRIVAVAQSNRPPVDVVDMSLTKIVQMIRGPKGTEVRLTLMPESAKSERRIVTLIRDQIPLEDQAAKSRIIELPDGKGNQIRLGVIDLPSFYAPMDLDGQKRRVELANNVNTNKESSGFASVDVARLLTKFKQEKVSGVILDLRGNGGGVLAEAIRLAGLFIKDGPVVQASELNGSVQVYPDPDPTELYGGPLIVLTSRFSASASEIVAAALQDYGRALIVGDTSTHGKGTVQTVSDLNSLLQLNDPDPDKFGALKFTIRKFYRPTGLSTQLRGVLADIVLPSQWNFATDIGESALENPLQPDKIRSVKFDKLNLVEPYLSELLRRSSERVATNQDFNYVREDIEEFRKRQADKTMSLNEQQWLKDQAVLDQRVQARETELRARPETDEKVYELPLKLSGVPGLPPAVQKTNAAASKLTRVSGAAGTNTASVAHGASVPRETAALDDADKPAMPDADLNEAKRILLDYIQLISSDRGVTVVPATKPAG
jgi:carboxyl-terminal processing protease